MNIYLLLLHVCLCGHTQASMITLPDGMAKYGLYRTREGLGIKGASSVIRAFCVGCRLWLLLSR